MFLLPRKPAEDHGPQYREINADVNRHTKMNITFTDSRLTTIQAIGGKYIHDLIVNIIG